MTHWDPDESDWSPNRLDALVWAMPWLADLGRDPKIRFAWTPVVRALRALAMREITTEPGEPLR